MPGETILVIDDVVVNLKIACAVLRHEGYTVQTAQDGQEALDLLRTLRPDLILSDIQMPCMDGLEMARRVKQDDRLRGIPLVALSAYSTRVDQERAAAAGFDGYLTKPVDTRTLGQQIRGYLDRAATPS